MEAKKQSIIFDILLTIITFGIWNLWVQARQMGDINEVMGRDEFPTSLILLIFYTIITFGLYFIYHEFRMTKELHLLNFNKRNFPIELGMSVLTFFGLWFLVDSYQQNLLNEYLEDHPHNLKRQN